MNLLVDMNLSPRWAAFLEAEGFPAAHWSAIGPAPAPDEEIMAYAAAHGLVVLTHDLDFGAMLAASRSSAPSVVQIRARDITPEAIGSRVVASLRQAAAELTAGALMTIDTDRARLRLLPLRGKND